MILHSDQQQTRSLYSAWCQSSACCWAMRSQSWNPCFPLRFVYVSQLVKEDCRNTCAAATLLIRLSRSVNLNGVVAFAEARRPALSCSHECA
jgi:hypothetical protein